MGVERILALWLESGGEPDKVGPEVYVVHQGRRPHGSLSALPRLCGAWIRNPAALRWRQFQIPDEKADASGAPFALVIGEDEAAAGEVTLKPMRGGEQRAGSALMSWHRRWQINSLRWMATMAVYDLEEQEQISEIKAWWETYGKLVTTAVVVVAMSSVGWQGWNWYQRNAGTSEASLLYVTAVNAGSANDAQKVREAAGQLIEALGQCLCSAGALVARQGQAEAGDYRTLP